MLQEFLNRSDDHLWAFVSNGLKLRILRDNVSLTRQAYVEFDLESMMDGEVYSDFTVLWLLCHQSRIESERPEQCFLEKWLQLAQEQGTRALDQLRNGVEDAISALGSGFLAHPANIALKEKLRSGDLDKQDYYRQLLRIVYRVLFLFVAEDRELLLDPNARPEARERYSRWYSTSRLRQLASRHRGTEHADLWHMVKLVFRALGDSGVSPPNPRPGDQRLPRTPNDGLPPQPSLDATPESANGPSSGTRREDTGQASKNTCATGAAQRADRSHTHSGSGFQRDASLWQGCGDSVPTSPGCPELALPALGSFLWSDHAVSDLIDCELRNRDLLNAVRALAITTEKNVRRTVDFKNLGSEELGSVYESLLELHPDLNAESATFALTVAAGHERKTTGSYYTPTSLVNCLLDSALNPVLDEAIKGTKASGALPQTPPGNLDSPDPSLHRLPNQPAPGATPDSANGTPSAARNVEGGTMSGCAGVETAGVGAHAQTDSGLQRDASLCRGDWGASSPPQTAEDRILSLKVCDPACGSGHFLIAAAHRIARKLAAVRTGDDEPAPEAYRHALRDVIGHCIYGVDINPMAVELCKVSLWLEAIEPGRPLSFLDHHIQCGNSLLGTTPKLMKDGIPDDAFKPIEGDDKAYCTELRKQNREERKGQDNFLGDLFAVGESAGIYGSDIGDKLVELDALDDNSLEAVKAKEKAYRQLQESEGVRNARLLCDTWCSAFVWKKARTEQLPYPPTEQVFRKIERNPNDCPDWMLKEITRLTDQYQFFHWHIKFPDVFHQTDSVSDDDNRGWEGGFDCVLGNPPWERVKLQEKEWFSERSPEIAAAPNSAARGAMIKKLKESEPALHTAFLRDKREAEGTSSLLRNTGLFPLCGRGDINTYTVFAELNRGLLANDGRVGCIVPSGIATDDTTKYFFQDIVDSGSLVSLYDFENRQGIFQGVHRSYKFCLLTMAGANRPAGSPADFVYFALDPAELHDRERHFSLSADEVALLNPNTRTCPIFRRKCDAELTKATYRRVPVLSDTTKEASKDNSWNISFMRMFDMSNDSHLFHTREDLESKGTVMHGNRFADGNREYLPLYEAKMIHHYDHRWGSYDPDGNIHDLSAEEKDNPDCAALPRYWVEDREVYLRIAELPPALMEGLRERSTEKTVLGLAHIFFGLYLLRQEETVEALVPALFSHWNSFIDQHPFARGIPPDFPRTLW